MKVFLNSFENSSSSITKNQVATILNKTIEEAGFKQEEFTDKELSISCVSEKEIKLHQIHECDGIEHDFANRVPFKLNQQKKTQSIGIESTLDGWKCQT